MHSITKNHLSKILALTTMFSSIAILPVAKASGTEPENIPQLKNSRSETQVITDEMINQAIAELNEHFGGENEFASIVKRDEIKRKLCESYGLTLVYYTDKDFLLTEEFKRRTAYDEKSLIKLLNKNG